MSGTQQKKIIIILGMPGVGKTTLMRSLINHLGTSFKPYAHGMLSGQVYQDVLVLGKYEQGETFAGTDRWSMGMQKDVQGFWASVPYSTLIGEGSRIATRPFIDAAIAHADVSLVFLQADEQVVQERRTARSNQSASWVKGIQTRLDNLSQAYHNRTYFLSNASQEDIERNTLFLLDILRQPMEKSVSIEDIEQVEHKRVPLELIRNNPKNYNQHPPEQIRSLEASLTRFGQIEDSVVKRSGNGYMLVAGEGITTAAKGLVRKDAERFAHLKEWNVVIVPQHWTELDIDAYMVASNELSKQSVPDDDGLAELLQEQQKAGFDITALGMDDEWLREMVESADMPVFQERAVNLPTLDEAKMNEHGVPVGLTPDERLDTYENTQLRQIILVFLKERYVSVMANLTAVRRAEKLETNAEAVEALVEFYLAQHPSIKVEEYAAA